MAVDNFAKTKQHAFDDLLSIGHVGHRLAHSFIAEDRMIVVPPDIGIGWGVIFILFEIVRLNRVAVGATHHLHRLQHFHEVEAAALQPGQCRVHIVHDAELQPIDVRLIDSFLPLPQ